MSGFETGAIHSIKNNQSLRRGPGQKFKKKKYLRGVLPISSSTQQNSSLLKRADEQRQASIKKQLLWVVLAALIAYFFIMKLLAY